MSLTIEQDAEGTLLHGTSRGDGTAELVKRFGFRWSGRLGAWFYPRNRTVPLPSQLTAWAAQLTEAGHPCEVEVTSATVAEQEAARAERLDERADRHDARAVRREAESDARLAAAKRTADMIPLGQPILVGHHSEGRHRRDIARIEGNYRKGFEAHAEAQEAARRADSTRRTMAHRESAPTTMRRIERLEVELRQWQRAIARSRPNGLTDDDDSAWAVRARENVGRLTEQIEHWKAHLAQLEASGVKVWSRETVQAEIAKQAEALGASLTRTEVKVNGSWSPLIRLNAKSLTIDWQTVFGTRESFPRRATYDDVRAVRVIDTEAVSA